MSQEPDKFHVEEAPRIKQDLLERLRREVDRFGRTSQDSAILRAEVQVLGLDSIDWLCAQRPMARGYWADREEAFEVAGTGRADMIAGDVSEPFVDVVAKLMERITTCSGDIRYIGGFRFDERGNHDPAWDRFKSYRFILPRFEVLRRGNETILACNMRSDDSLDQVASEINSLILPDGPTPESLPIPIHRRNHPDLIQWESMVRSVLEGIESGKYKKIVLAREVVLEFERPVNPPYLLKALKANSHSCFHFCFQPHPTSAFVGASPERLYRRDGKNLKTEAIAGTRPRGSSETEEATFRRILLESRKDEIEHQFVVDSIRESLSTRTVSLDIEMRPSILSLTHAQHLITRFEGRLDEFVSDGQLLETLHPTPAVGGLPREEALDEIARLEPFDRGWYAAPVGWIGRDAAQFVVGIRAGLIDGNRLHLYSGAGIVADSDPRDEWDEVENKIADFLDVLSTYEQERL